MITAELTKLQREVLGYIKQKLDVDGISPTVQEIQWQFGFKSPNAVQTHLLALTKKGYVRRHGRQARSLRLVGEASSRNDNGNATLVAPPSGTVPPVPDSPVYPPGGAESYQNGDGGAAPVFPPTILQCNLIVHLDLEDVLLPVFFHLSPVVNGSYPQSLPA